eukprot:CAMPEP_0183493400 /NCGR_PEP_ID=MMETSP0370-20130417/183431_1 /TAXON_ID=268820 /ORGANISM="Peridinium aciculiferum, Strain PAER-2" /LENGTH=559 /DNA_ID=CAMNT_0025686743 /DNA_START=64 /DNA_END=1746 /DNA_ORIENTATION=-
MAPPMDVMTSSDEESQEWKTSQSRRLSPAVLLAGAAGVATAVLLACHASGSMSRAPPQPLTVRALLESDELAGDMTRNIMAFGGPTAAAAVRALLESDELAGDMTRNIMAFGGDADQEHVHQRVVAGLGEIRDAIQEQQPEAHNKMGLLTLSPTQKEAAMRVLKKYSDSRLLGLTQKVVAAVRETAEEQGDQAVLARKLSERLTPSLSDMRQLHKEMFQGWRDAVLKMYSDSRMLSLTQKVAAAVRETAQENGDQAVLARKLGERLTPNFSDMRQLHKEMFPGASDEFKLDLNNMPALKNWNGELKVDLARRLFADNSDVHSQAHTLFQGLERELGDEMPKAPARMLLSLDSLLSSSTPASSTAATSSGETSFMDCVMKAVPDPMKVCSCIASNMSEVVSMVMGFMKGKLLEYENHQGPPMSIVFFVRSAKACSDSAQARAADCAMTRRYAQACNDMLATLSLPFSSNVPSQCTPADNSDVHSQAHTLFQGLERELGDEMPKAPGRMLLDAMSSSTSEKPSFMDCVMKAVPDPTKVCSCIAANMSEVLSIVMNLMKGKA